MTPRLLLRLAAVLLLAGCAAVRPPVDQRTTQGPTAEEMWLLRVAVENGREPNYEEHRQWESELDQRISDYLRQHPEVANSFEVSRFRFWRQAAVGMSPEQVLILLGPPLAITTDTGAMETAARRFWPVIQGNVTELWIYPLGWNLFFSGPRLADITRYQPS